MSGACCTSYRCDGKDSAFMGITHAFSGLALMLALLAFAPSFFIFSLGEMPSAKIIALMIFVTVGGALIPDLDNTASRAKSDLGIFGNILSVLFRTSSMFLQTAIRTKRDDPEPNPHRGAWHTILGAFILSGLIYWATTISAVIKVPFTNVSMSLGAFIGVIVVSALVMLALSSLTKTVTDKIRQGFLGDVIVFAFSVVITVYLFDFSSANGGLWWLFVALSAGMILHDVGDAFTTYGSPIFAPFTVIWRKKVWWTTRFLPIKAGGPFEYYVFLPLFLLISVISAIKLLS